MRWPSPNVIQSSAHVMYRVMKQRLSIKAPFNLHYKVSVTAAIYICYLMHCCMRGRNVSALTVLSRNWAKISASRQKPHKWKNRISEKTFLAGSIFTYPVLTVSENSVLTFPHLTQPPNTNHDDEKRIKNLPDRCWVAYSQFHIDIDTEDNHTDQ